MAPKAAASASSTKKSSSKSADSESGSKVKQPKLPTEFILRPSPKTSLKDTANIYVSLKLLQITEWKTGNFIKVSKGLSEISGVLSTWPETDEEKYDLNVILISESYLRTAGYLLGDRVSVTKIATQPLYAPEVTVVLKETKSDDDLTKALTDIGVLYERLTFPDFKVVSIITTESLEDKLKDLSLEDTSNSDINNKASPFLFHPKTTKLTISRVEGIEPVELPFSYSKIGGLKKEISKLQETISIPLFYPDIFKRFGIQPPRGLLLHGNSGTGKSLLLKAIAYECPNCHIIKINGPAIVSKYLGGTEEKLREYFKEATKYQPSIVFIDEIDSLVPSRNSDDSTEVDSRVIATLTMLLDGLDGAVAVIGATNRINMIDSTLRRPGRFDQELEIPIPDIDSRFDILLKQFESMKGQHDLSEAQIKSISDRTHGYVGADLVSLCRESIMKCVSRGLTSGVNGLASLDVGELNNLKVTFYDIEESMKEIRPSAMREIILEMPKVTWDDIGGQEILKRKLREMVQLPLTAADTFKKLGISAPKGLLLYGPPGCSKTLTAKALASESGLNFLAIKGPEIFNKYVGESEKKIREIFRKARLSSPSIIFIDEIDALATDRESEDSSNVSKQVLNSMLNEIDGVEELKGVIIIGATNRPDSIDPALLRPGRLDRHVYVSPPDRHARLQILDKNTKDFQLEDRETLLNKLSELTDGFSGSECVLLCQEAGLTAIMEDNNCSSVREEHFTTAMNDISKNITPEMLQYYREFGEKYRAI